MRTRVLIGRIIEPMANDKKPKPPTKEDLKKDHLLETFPDVDSAPGKPRTIELTPEQVAAAHKRFSDARAGRGKPGT